MDKSPPTQESENRQNDFNFFIDNKQVFFDKLPTTSNLNFSSLQPSYRIVSLITTTVIFLILGSIGSMVVYFNGSIVGIINYVYLLLLTLYFFFMIMVYNGFKKKSYAIRERDLVYNEGILWQSTIVIPFNRVQHCEISQGPVERIFNLAELKIFTAGGSSSDMSIPGLDPSVAEQIKEFIVFKTGFDEEE